MDINKVLTLGNNDYARKILSIISKSEVEAAVIEEGAKAPFSPGLIIEAIPGSPETKRRALMQYANSGTLLATTIAGGVTEVAAGTGRESEVVGLHFIFNPVEEKCLVEIVRGLGTSSETVQACRAIVEKAGAVAVMMEDVQGLIIDRTMASVINEAAFMYETKLASLEDINRIPKLCLNWPLGPFEFADVIGIDNIVATLEAASQYSTQYLPCRLLREMAAAGRLGRKTGHGFYEYFKK